MSKKNFWYKLIEAARKSDIVIDGLTIPFFIGAYKYADPGYGVSSNSIYELLKEIANAETEEKAVLKYSPNNQYIITLRTAEFCSDKLSNELAFKNKKGNKALYVTADVALFGNTIAAISRALHEEYKTFIERDTFSWNDRVRTWHSFTDTEKNVIAEAAK